MTSMDPFFLLVSIPNNLLMFRTSCQNTVSAKIFFVLFCFFRYPGKKDKQEANIPDLRPLRKNTGDKNWYGK